MKILTIIKKNMKFLLHHKLSATIVLAGPFIIILLAWLAFSSSALHGINVGIVEKDLYNGSVIDVFSKQIQSDDFNIVRYKNIEDCSLDLKNKKAHICVEYNESQKTMKFYVDPTRSNLVYVLLNIVSNQMNTATDDMRYMLTNTLISKISDINDMLKRSQGEIDSVIDMTSDLGEGINGVSNGVMVMQIGFDASKFDLDSMTNKTKENNQRIIYFEGYINSEIYSSIKKLDEFGGKAEDLKAQIEGKKKEREKIDADLNDAYEAYNCSDTEAIDLIDYYSDPDSMLELLDSLEKPECSYVYTIRKSMDKCTGDLDQASEDIDLIMSNISDAKDDLEALRDQSAELFSSAKDDLHSTIDTLNETGDTIEDVESDIKRLEESKKELISSLKEIETGVNDSYYYLVTFNGSISNLTQDLGVISNVSADRIVRPIINSVEGFEEEKTQIDYLFPTLLVFIITFVGILLGNILAVKEKFSRAFFRNLISPTRDLMLLIGTYSTTLIIISMQLLLIMGVVFLFMSLHIKFVSLGILIVLFLGISVFIFIGTIFGNFMQSEDTSIIISVIIGLMLMIFSGTLLPMEFMPAYAHFIIKMNPFYIVQNLLSAQMVSGVALSNILRQVSVLFAYFVSLGLLSWISFEYAKSESKR